MLGRGNEGFPLDWLRLMPVVPDLVIPFRSVEVAERFLAGSNWPWGPGMHDAAMDLLAEPAFDDGMDWLSVMLPLIQGERFDPEIASRRGLIPGLPYGFERVFEAGGLAGAWPLAIACGVVALRGSGAASLPGFFATCPGRLTNPTSAINPPR